jgi:hypothetical protein
VPGLRLKHAFGHVELAVAAVDDDPERPRFHCRIVHERAARPFRGFNRAQGAVIEAAILSTRLNLLPRDKVEGELAYLAIAIEKTAGAAEAEAWGWIVERIRGHYDRPGGGG